MWLLSLLPACQQTTVLVVQFLKMDLEGTRSADLQQQLSEQACNVTDACATVNANKSEVNVVAAWVHRCTTCRVNEIALNHLIR